MKRLLTYGLLLLTILASHFVVSACQDDLPETTEVMMTFTTRAVVSDIISSDAPDEDKMKDLRVIMLRQDGTVVDNHIVEDINASSVKFTFTTPIQTGGEDFTFLAVANEKSIQSTSTIDWLKCSSGVKLSEETITQIKEQQIGNGEAFNISDGPIPQTKQWTVHVPQQDTHVENQTLDFVASKISVQFINNTNAEQSLNDVNITGIGYNVYGYLFAHNSADFVGENHNASDITFTDVTNLAVGATSAAQTYYTYPIGSLSSPTLHATWNGSEYDLPIKINDEFITSLNRNDHLQIVVTLTGQELVVNYTIAPWNADNTTNIGSPTTGGGYNTEEWTAGGEVNIGGDPVEPDEPVVPGDVIWYMNGLNISPNYSNPPIQLSLSNEVMEKYFVEGNVFGVNYDISSDNGGKEFYIRKYDIGGGHNMNTLPSASGNVFSNDGVNEFVLTADDIAAINLNDGTGTGGISFWGNNITVTQIYIKAPETQ